MLLQAAAEVADWQLLGAFEHVKSRDLLHYIKMFVVHLDSYRKTHSCEIWRSYIASELFEHQMQSLAFAWTQI